MASQMVCSCGLRYQYRGPKVDQHPRCPVCGKDLKVSSSSSRGAVKEPRSFAWLKIGIGVVSAVGLLALWIFIMSPEITGTKPPPRAVAAPSTVKPVSTATSPPAPAPASPINTLEQQMLPVGPIGGN